MNVRLLAAAAVSVLASCIVVHDGGGGGGGDGGDAAAQSPLDHDIQICRQAHRTFIEAGCPTNASYDCVANAEVKDRAGCLDEDIAWWECIDAWSSDQCARGCDPYPSVDCMMAYCGAHPADPACTGPSPS
ncbi:MAG: hypothetical protein K8W52_18220 [Deltaproteobacteria bacterium]|nr:hypothetical protein [Deltaproteobacteria bacterium]